MRGYCNKHSIQLAVCGGDKGEFNKLLLPQKTQNEAAVHMFDEPIEALDWAEEALLASLGMVSAPDNSEDGVTNWLSTEIGRPIAADVVESYFERIDLPAGDRLYAQGDPADTIDFVAVGTVAMMLELGSGQRLCVRRSSRQTVTGEMGFFRNAKRSTNVIAERPTIVYSLSRTSFERLRQERPEIHDGLLTFIIRVLSDRLDTATGELSAMRYVDIE
jgi:sulfate permease, SulP family